ncbi:SulP family inorganic anion transporter [Pseudemcibacter aquimaris]|uniref:SulP family inorganic anion transporter n=1 Tax=Pseudemcibacter aquimaris TaxID=2857064 RepID=UPI0020129A20|nr:sulfate permease [Pseudemcibacter aquimaris]MCC3862579.1 sulfate permease [Pseudemcibacter aquimaris]WDU57903.1 sulfate permease [Pseudemcibacter aquimaris]
MKKTLSQFLPILNWGKEYSKEIFVADAIAALIVTVMLIPQSLAYALLAGLPAEVGLYASIAPLILYTIFGTSRTLSVGPVAIISLMTATAIGAIAEPGTIGYLETAIALSLLSGIFLTLMGLFRLGFIANFLSHPVMAGFITASGLLIALSQLKHILGISISGHNLTEQLASLFSNIGMTQYPALLIGAGSIIFLLFIRNSLENLLKKIGLSDYVASLLVKAGPVFAVMITIILTASLSLDQKNLDIVGMVPQGLPSLQLPELNMDIVIKLGSAALLISLVGFVESISVAQTLAAKRRQHINPNQELIALGMSNIGSSAVGGYPVTGGFARSVVNFDAGAVTPAAGGMTAIGIALATLFLTPFLYYLPKATLAATIIIAVMGLVKIQPMIDTWRYSKSDFFAMAVTILLTLFLSVEAGIITGVASSFILFMYKTTKPHYAVVGRVDGTEHFRNIKRHNVITDPRIISIRIDESLYFSNIRYLENEINKLVAAQPECEHIILMCSAVNSIDSSALESLESINHRLIDANVKLHMSEVKGPVTDKLSKTTFMDDLSGQIFLSQYEAFNALSNNSPT